ncbi:alpha-L-rhamnosidase, partial [Streptomyces sp. NPDC127574]
MTAAGVPFAGAASAAGRTGSAGTPSGAVPRAGKGWQHYVQAPASRTVQPVRVIASTGDVTRAEGLLKPGGARAGLRRPQASPAPRWPERTGAVAASGLAGHTGTDGPARS